jgi:hypothetical protein
MKQKNEWVKIAWDGNKALGYECWRKKFGKGHVSVGCGEYLGITYSHGANSDDSCGGTRWNYDLPPLTEEEAMAEVDMQGGKYDYKVRHPKRKEV